MKKRILIVLCVVLLVASSVALVACKKSCDHYNRTTELTASTCLKQGVIKYICEDCGKVIRTEWRPLADHVDSNGDCRCDVCNVETHTYLHTTKQEPTCTMEGIASCKCKNCGKETFEEISMLRHVEETMPAVPATCTTAGLTAGTKCSLCGTILKEQTVVDPLGHSEYDVPECLPTCTSEGYTAWVQCSRCLEILRNPEIIDPIGHTPQEVPEKPSTCIVPGTTAGVICSVCYKVLDGCEEIPALGHTEVTVPAQAPTCVSVGYTEFKKCSVCNAIFEKPTEIPMIDHNPVPMESAEPTCTTDGYTAGIACEQCGKAYEGHEIISALGHLDEDKNCLCDRCDYQYEHIPENVAQVDPACEQVGWTECVRCSVCHTVLTAPQEIPALTHVFTSGICSICGGIQSEDAFESISTAEELLAIANGTDKCYRLDADINLNNQIWEPIEEFNGILAGAGHTIKNFSVTANSPGENFGMFRINNGIIRDIVFSQFTFNMTSPDTKDCNIGALVGKNNGQISGCKFDKCVISMNFDLDHSPRAPGIIFTANFGILVGQNIGTITDCYCISNFSSSIHFYNSNNSNWGEQVDFRIGGFVGQNQGKLRNSEIEQTVSIRTQEDSAKRGLADVYLLAGGAVGYQNGGGITENCYVKIDLTHVGIDPSKVSPYAHEYGIIGGIVGENDGAGSIVSSCCVTGSISGGFASESVLGGCIGRNVNNASAISSYAEVALTTSKDGSIGGFVGDNQSIVQNSYATGDVKCNATCNAGGFAGVNASSGTTFKCYATGDVTSTTGKAGFFVGTSEGIISKCYHLNSSIVQVDGQLLQTVEYNTIEGVLATKLWSTELLVEELYWDAEGWIILTDENPLLKWELERGHKFDSEVVEPTCIYGGFTVYYCSDCGVFFALDYVAPTGHNWTVESTISPSCTMGGKTRYACSQCGEKKEEVSSSATGHPADKLTVLSEQKPTCTEAGFALCHCEVCSLDVRVEYPATGHVNNTLIEVIVEATCCSLGEETYRCDVCGVHTEITDFGDHKWEYFEEKPANCGIDYDALGNPIGHKATPGHLAYSQCAVCGKYDGYDEEPVIEPHDWQVVETKKQATCYSAGLGVEQCKICGATETREISKVAHTDVNRDNICDVPECQALLFTSLPSSRFTHISSVAELRAITNMNGYYWLDCDLDLSSETSWTPIGTQQNPFRGVFYGASHTITGASFSFLGAETDAYAGLFGYSKGTIANVIVKNWKITVNNADATYGGVVAYNMGTVAQCIVNGLTVDIVSETVVSGAVNRTASGSAIVGGVVGVNEGTVNECYTTGKITTKITNKAVVKLDIPTGGLIKVIADLLTNAVRSASIKSTLHVTYGGIVARNKGTVTDCSAQAEAGELVHNRVDTYSHGSATAITEIYSGALVGYNTGSVTNCSAKKTNYKLQDGERGLANLVDYRTDLGFFFKGTLLGSLYSQESQINYYGLTKNGYDGVIGFNSGTCSDILLLS